MGDESASKPIDPSLSSTPSSGFSNTGLYGQKDKLGIFANWNLK